MANEQINKKLVANGWKVLYSVNDKIGYHYAAILIGTNKKIIIPICEGDLPEEIVKNIYDIAGLY